ncbi:GNAT family N-acetyltransferase [Bacillus sp. 37MA]|uniref:GNAT family N-acetyltransferase n=1 Tax=Bacillus sp. 37MA TaxID=1132442 RepID=UPI000363C44F|nr:GNAT family N-acetyltransferase [Bacillus sp. 37MA]
MKTEPYLKYELFADINLDDPFFDSLKEDYPEFEKWFHKKGNERAYILRENDLVEGFLYLKYEHGPIDDVYPVIDCTSALKIGTLKINPHGTRLGERFIKKALDHAIAGDVELCYVTVFEKQSSLLKIFEKYGFTRFGQKSNGELVLVKNLVELSGEVLKDYPLISTQGKQKYLLAIYPQYHSIMFPDSILNNENINVLEDCSVTNSIHKIYVTTMKVNRANPGDIFVMYRTATPGKSAEYSSVVSSICVVEEVKSQHEFANFDDFFQYATTYSIFDYDDLKYWYNKGGCYTVKMTYNVALSKRLIRQKLADEIGLDRNTRWSFIKLTDKQFNRILEEGGVSEGIIID